MPRKAKEASIESLGAGKEIFRSGRASTFDTEERWKICASGRRKRIIEQ